MLLSDYAGTGVNHRLQNSGQVVLVSYLLRVIQGVIRAGLGGSRDNAEWRRAGNQV